MAKLNKKTRDSLKDSDFGIPSKRMYPIHDKAHVEAAVKLFGHASNEDKPELAHNILRKAKEFGMDSSGWTQINEWAKKYKGKNTNESADETSDDEIVDSVSKDDDDYEDLTDGITEAAAGASLLTVKNQLMKLVGNAFKFIGGSLVPKFTMQSTEKPQVSFDVNAVGQNVEVTPKYNGTPDTMHKRKGIAFMRAADTIANFVQDVVNSFNPAMATEGTAFIQIDDMSDDEIILQENEDFDAYMSDIGFTNEDYIQRPIIIVDENANDEPDTYDRLLEEHSFDPETNTIVINGRTINAGNLGSGFVRDRMNAFIQEFGSEQILFCDKSFGEQTLEDIYDAYIHESYMIDMEFQELIQEGKVWEGIKKGLGQIWEWIKSFFRWLGKKLAALGRFIAGLFRKKTKSADQCVDEALGGSKVHTEAAVDNVKKVHKAIANGLKAAQYNVQRIIIKGNRTSEIQEESVEVVLKKLKLKISSDKSSLIVESASAGPFGFTRYKKTEQDGMVDRTGSVTDVGAARTPFLAIYLLTGGDIKGYKFDDIINVLTHLCEEIKDYNPVSKETETELGKIVEASKDLFGILGIIHVDEKKKPWEGKQISYNQIRNFGSKINQFTQVMNNVNMSQGRVSEKVHQYLSKLINLFENLQMSFNDFSNEINSLWAVDAHNAGIIKTPEELSDISKTFVKSGIPPKFIRHNILILAAANLWDGDDPGIGQSRLCLIPKDGNVVYKVAINGMGFSGNKCETKQTEELKKYPGGVDLIAPVEKNYGNYVISQMKCSFDNISEDASKILENEIDNFYLSETGWQYPYELKLDLHSKNIAMNPNTRKPVIIDYGFFKKRKAIKPTKRDRVWAQARRNHPESALNHVTVDWDKRKQHWSEPLENFYTYQSKKTDQTSSNEK
jgi:hypothetical protein